MHDIKILSHKTQHIMASYKKCEAVTHYQHGYPIPDSYAVTHTVCLADFFLSLLYCLTLVKTEHNYEIEDSKAQKLKIQNLKGEKKPNVLCQTSTLQYIYTVQHNISFHFWQLQVCHSPSSALFAVLVTINYNKKSRR